ncbi:MAG: ABC transporter permease [Desulfobacula sp.]|jgi:peptide/nickel transport system permease protein|uniref:ABC transporter permease n=1 Tax=Desulfobacula sp. TaxID=2593537 RepID=UPI001D35DDE0|nr:ABC transporter permease [Desulfobacula sp.]MBT3486818.1 ABC transporter permease [Desulfobacula sp.]MBT3803430.1 ABC transporter permease [Desulfobacula sp.]MBT4024351.1 ABC transporter permease [Desulfobacula sp.]MBT4199662.1 ABC transporter permease [Desulfobacula sp.]
MTKFQKFKESYFLYSFKRDKVAIASFIVLVILIILALTAPWIAPMNPYDAHNIDIMDSEIPPMWSDQGESRFILGTDNMGRDMLSTMLYGLRTSILIAVGAVFLQATIGILVGLTAGYIGGKTDAILMRIADIQFSFPYLMLAIFISAIFQAIYGIGSYERLAVPLLIVIIGLAEWPMYARTIRASVIGEVGKEYVEAARVIGLSRPTIMIRHVLPNSLTSLMVISTIQFANAVMSEAALSFLGMGMPVTKPSLGSLIQAGFDFIFSGSWWITIFPGIWLVLFVLVVNLLGDWLRDVLNPKLYKG